MASGGLQGLGIALCVLGLVGAIVCCAVPKWNQSSFVGSSIVVAQTFQDGIWMSCVTQSTGQQQCKVYDSVLGLSRELQAARALTVLSIALSALGLLLSLAGANFTTCLGGSERVKGKAAALAGALLALAGLLLLVPVSWSAHSTIARFHDPAVTDKRDIGASVWVGWASAALLMLGGALLCCSWPRGGEGGGYAAKYVNNPPAPSRTRV